MVPDISSYDFGFLIGGWTGIVTTMSVDPASWWEVAVLLVAWALMLGFVFPALESTTTDWISEEERASG